MRLENKFDNPKIVTVSYLIILVKKNNKQNDSLEPGKVANRLNSLSVKIFTTGMSNVNRVRQDAWNKSFAFTVDLKNYINSLSGEISLGGGEHGSNITRVTVDLLRKLQKKLNSEEFEKNMKIAKPNVDNPALIKAWEDAFTFPKILKEFVTEMVKKIEEGGGSMSSGLFVARLNFYLDKIEKK